LGNFEHLRATTWSFANRKKKKKLNRHELNTISLTNDWYEWPLM